MYRLIRGMWAVVFRLAFRYRVVGVERVPAAGGLIVAANHFSWLDPPNVAVGMPRPVHFMAKSELFRYPVFGAVIRAAGAYPVRRGTADRQAFVTTLRLLEEGRMVGMFPEGTRIRTGALGPPEPGVGLLALRSRAAVLPVANIGPYRLGGRVELRVGEPLRFDEWYGEKITMQRAKAVAEEIMAAIARLRDGVKPGADEVSGGAVNG